MKYKLLLFSILISIVFSFSSFISGPDLVVKVVRDEISASNTFTLGVFKNKSFKNMDDKYKIISYDLYVLNYRGETKWFSEMEEAEVDLSKYEEAEVVRGDLLVIDNIKVVHQRSGEVTEINRITERYLVR